MQSFFRYTYFFYHSLFHPRWDTNISPPELMEFLQKNPPGKAIDLGCGTGTNVITMAKYGWDATGVDYIPMNIFKAKRKVVNTRIAGKAGFICGSVVDLESTMGPFHLILDMGCYHGLSPSDRQSYQSLVVRLAAAGATYMLYGMLSGSDLDYGLTNADLASFQESFTLLDRSDSKDHNRPSTWWTFRKE